MGQRNSLLRTAHCTGRHPRPLERGSQAPGRGPVPAAACQDPAAQQGGGRSVCICGRSPAPPRIPRPESLTSLGAALENDFLKNFFFQEKNT